MWPIDLRLTNLTGIVDWNESAAQYMPAARSARDSGGSLSWTRPLSTGILRQDLARALAGRDNRVIGRPRGHAGQDGFGLPLVAQDGGAWCMAITASRSRKN